MSDQEARLGDGSTPGLVKVCDMETRRPDAPPVIEGRLDARLIAKAWLIPKLVEEIESLLHWWDEERLTYQNDEDVAEECVDAVTAIETDKRVEALRGALAKVREET